MTEFEGSDEIIAGGEDQVEPGVQGDVEGQQLPVDRHAQVGRGVAIIVILELTMNVKLIVLMRSNVYFN